jgi:ribosomal protein S18 acetylase RimI-like enzyme
MSLSDPTPSSPDANADPNNGSLAGYLPFEIRSFKPGDLPTCRKLYVEGHLAGKLAENDTGFDIDDIVSAYMSKAGSHFWVAETVDGQIVGMIGVQHHGDGVGEIRRLRVCQQHRRRGIGKALVEAAVRFCNENGYLKVTLDTFIEREPAIKLFEKFRFHHARTRKVGEKELMYFYLDLYQDEKRNKGS